MEKVTQRLEAPLNRALERGVLNIQVTGTSSNIPLARLFSGNRQADFFKGVHLIVTPDRKRADTFMQDLRFFGHEGDVFQLPAFDMSPYSGLYPNARVISQRVNWLHQAQNARPGSVFLADIESLLQNTMSPHLLSESKFHLEVDSELPNRFGALLSDLGYHSAPTVEDPGQYAIRGGIIDVYSPAHALPTRIELFGDTIESMRHYDPETQRSSEATRSIDIIPCREIIITDETRSRAANMFREHAKDRRLNVTDYEQTLQDIVLGRYFHGMDYLIDHFYDELSQPLEHFKSPLTVWRLDPLEITRLGDFVTKEMTEQHVQSFHNPILPDVTKIYSRHDSLKFPPESRFVEFSKIQIENVSADETDLEFIEYRCSSVKEFQTISTNKPSEFFEQAKEKIKTWVEDHYHIVISTHTQSQAQRLSSFLKSENFEISTLSGEDSHWQWKLGEEENRIHILPRILSESVRIPEDKVLFLREEDFFGKKSTVKQATHKRGQDQRTENMSFAELKPGDKIVHIDHGVAIFEGLKVMSVYGAESEFLQLRYKDDDKLYLPVYRVGQIQKFTGIGSPDKLGGTNWEKTKIKVKSRLRDIANDLLQLYASRAQVERPSFSLPNSDFKRFEAFFPYEETQDQIKAIDDILEDFRGKTPMDRLVCGDVGFGKTEVAMRAAFKVIEDGFQVAVLVPTTILAIQHLENFRKRFQDWPVKIGGLSRFTPGKEARETVEALKQGKVDLVIGTHRLLSKDVGFKNLGLLVIDEEQRFGVGQKEKIRRVRSNVDTLAMSATPIPRTLNMSFVGIRDLSLINTAPRDRLPTRTFLCKFDEETIRKAILSEIQRGGQVFYVHNRVQSIYDVANQLKEIIPEARIQVGHGQMSERELEKTMLGFYHHEFDVLLSTTIIESGIDIPRANTMIVDRADTFGLSQLYQLRGRIGRSKERAYCYLLIPKSGLIDPVAQDRLKTLQEHSDLGSGIQIAHHDLELRGAGNLLGDAQAGHVEAVGYELYMELLEEAIRQAKGEPIDTSVEPEINVPIPALIPDKYIADIRVRLAFYRRLSTIRSVEEIDLIEDDLRDQFGAPPEPVINLMGLMAIRFFCKELGIRDLSAGKKNISLAFTDQTKLNADKVVRLATSKPEKFQITPDNRLIINLPEMSWPAMYEELIFLQGL